MANHSSNLSPLALEHVSLPALLQLLLSHPSPSHLVLCSSRSAFLDALHIEAAQEATATVLSSMSAPAPAHPLQNPTLRLLSSARRVSLAFCTSLHALRAHITIYASSPQQSAATPAAPAAAKKPISTAASTTSDSGGTCPPLLVVVNLVAAHRNDGVGNHFSAQGIGRTLASAVDAAATIGARLVLVERQLARAESANTEREERAGEGKSRQDEGVKGSMGPESDEEVGATAVGEVMAESRRGEDMDLDGDEMSLGEAERTTERDGEYDAGGEDVLDPWAVQLPILNFSAQRSGARGRAWMGRTVEARRVLERWCRFVRLNANEWPDIEGVAERTVT
ncbi:hypothetical protein BDY21DRAFT_199754 [Lineolata rhizophorae]|uniref:Uncharacterized protein n=1 Tax=Lineolata rhizophorae TaxID=578093 RepID=A0A6A6P5G2_9PEZI|nr:hypothetical protein BDY21DRAFT_199754 [Lineolata rhizophorae]